MSNEISETDPIIQIRDSEDSESLGSRICNPRKAFYRYFALIFMCLLSFGSYFCYDNPAALQDNFKKDLKISTATFTAFYSWYSWPNVVLCFLGGYLIDRVFGIRLGAIFFSTLVLSGQLVFAFGALWNKIWLMDVGRFIFGIGGESLAVAQNTYAVAWFFGKELNLVFGLQLSIARLGSTVNLIVMSPIYDAISKTKSGYECLGTALLIAAFTCVFSLGCASILALLDKRRTKLIPVEPVKAGDEIKLSDALKFPFSLWLVFIICVAFYCAVFPFISLGKVFFISKYDFSPVTANSADSIVYLISAFASPICGFLVDLIGFNTLWVTGAITATIGSHLLLAFTFINPFAAMILMGISYSLLAASLWPMVALIVSKHQLGTAYGLMQSVQNLGLALISLLTGIIVDEAGYFVLEVFFLGSLCVALLCSLLLYFYDNYKGGFLGVSKKRRQEMQKSESEE
ncbi:major facilitator superfamily domain-containing 1 isoform X2 [Brachionus plicatilis]|uniref:Lysosomal dipeptide transporter MFSD1 n=1 Tax=Brachionus plicatilis TaxID=10195 RepID=A0A3M7QZP8_BRAPC|nr:major facilitator superfamily domain-containing 1 isoform X2 [Brachionus plicatilis]